MAASMASSTVVFKCLLVCPVFRHIPAISFTRDELMDIQQYTPPDISPVFDYSLLDIVVNGSVQTLQDVQMREASWRVHEAQTALPSIHLANHHAVPNKTDKLLYSPRQIRIFQTLLLCGIPDSVLHLPNFQLFSADRNAESTGKSHCGGTCFYINERWCTDVTVLKKMCCPNLELLFINCKPFYSPREFCSFIIMSDYIPPQVHVRLAIGSDSQLKYCSQG